MPKVNALKTGHNSFRVDSDGESAISQINIGDQFEIDMPSASTGTVSMLRTWRMWMSEIAKNMAARGATMPVWPLNPEAGQRPFNANDAHESFTHLLLGCDEQGNRLSWSMGKGKNIAPKDKRLYAMDKLISWAFEEGITLKIPRNSEYSKLKAEQEQ